MMPVFLVRLVLPVLLPLGTRWIERQERRILAEGAPLNESRLADACALGIREPERIRLLTVDEVPLPGGSGLVRMVGLLTGTLSRQTSGMATGHGIFLRRPFQDDRSLLAHELTHVRQYERLGGIQPFLRQYLLECLTVGYLFAPLEEEARIAALKLCN